MPYGATDHLLLNAQAGWRAAFLDGTILTDTEAKLHLQPLPGTAQPLVDQHGSFGGLSLPTSLAVDAEDRVYILDRQAYHLKRFDPCTQAFEVLPCLGSIGSAPRQFRDPRGIAISNRGDLYVADRGNHRVQIFALKGLPLRMIWGPLRVIRDHAELRVEPAIAALSDALPEGVCQAEPTWPDATWEPWDIALSPHNWAYVSDYANGLIHVFDPGGRWSTVYTGEIETEPPLEHPTHIALDKDGRLYVVQEGKDYVSVLAADGTFLARVEQPEEVPGRFCPVAVAVDADGNVLISEHLTRRIYCYGKAPHKSRTAHHACYVLNDMGTVLAFDKMGHPLLSDAKQRQVLCLETQTAFVTSGQFYSEALDSRLYRCQWHRVVMHAAIVQGTHVQVDTLTSEAPKTIEEIRTLPDSRWETAQINAQEGHCEWDCLIPSPPGRYLWLRLTLVGEGTMTPTVDWAKVFYPRLSSLQYLPAVYQADPESRDFLDRFLSIFDTIRGGIASQITDIVRYFDAAATPADSNGTGEGDFLSWLASWLDLSFDRHWPEEKRRRLLQQAHRLYALRGTPKGLRQHIRLYADVEPQILEHFKLRRWLFLDRARLGAQSEIWGKEIVNRLQLGEHSQIGAFQLIDSGDPLRDPFHHYAHQFTVFVPLRGGGTEVQQQTLKRIVEMAKPAHTQGDVRVVTPRFRVGVQACIGLDTVIGEYPNQVVAGAGQIGYDTMLGPSPDEAAAPTMRIGIRARIGTSTLID